MAKRTADELRAKFKFVVEFRYKATAAVFDRKGALIEKLFEKFEDRLPHWRAEPASVVLLDNDSEPTQSIRVSHRRMNISFEDCDGGRSAFNEVVNESIAVLSAVVPECLGRIERVGSRFISLFEERGASSFDEVNAKMLRKYMANRHPLSVPVIDSRIWLVHESGQITVGPFREGESWIRDTFDRPEMNTPRFGFAVDCDSYVKDPTVKSANDLSRIVAEVETLGLAVERELLQDLLADDVA